jgi:GNAT superfamily N-acetyltransferase
MMKFRVRQADADDAAWMQESFKQIGWAKRDNYFAECCRQQAEGKLVLLVAEMEGLYLGHAKVVWQPDYTYFKENSIPEIQDLNVLPAYRRKGVATRLTDEAEAIIRQRSKVAGIGFGLYPDYGAAQRMYVRRGYVPDGKGMTYNDVYVQAGQSVVVDDFLTLYLVKKLE